MIGAFDEAWMNAKQRALCQFKRIEIIYLSALSGICYSSTHDENDASNVTHEEFAAALEQLGWKQSDFCRRTGLHKETPSRWATGKNPIPLWVGAYLGAMVDLARLHAKYVDPKASGALGESSESGS